MTLEKRDGKDLRGKKKRVSGKMKIVEKWRGCDGHLNHNEEH